MQLVIVTIVAGDIIILLIGNCTRNVFFYQFVSQVHSSLSVSQRTENSEQS